MGSADFTNLPVVDLRARGADGDHVLAEQIVDICHNVGFFILTNHGIEASFIDAVFSSMEHFFALPDKEKLRIDKRSSAQFRGWEGVGTERTNNRPDVREQIDFWTEWPERHLDVDPRYLRLLGSNQWMPDEIVPGQRAVVLEWFEQLGRLADRLLRLISIGLGLDEDHLLGYFGDEPMSLTKLISYPATPVGQAGVNAHHDTGFLTILAAGTTPGLQVQNHSGNWIDVPCIENTFVINLGEMLQAMTGNYLVATPHRVITAAPRLSAGYFHGPHLKAILDPLPLHHRFVDAVLASPHHTDAGFMAQRDATNAGVGDMQSQTTADTYGQQLWNYFARSYPENMSRHHH
ncbi:MAG: isopenicillin N synthase-like dioxygenase [Verrucomicrobiales bacterium]|jgi:isopenicillin N synthase-like dioxygenase